MQKISRLIDNEHGVALVLALMILLTLTGLVLAFLSASAFEPQISRNHSETVRARYVAEAGIEIAALRLASADTTRMWLPDGRPYRFELEDAQVEVRVRDESGRVDLNAAAPIAGAFTGSPPTATTSAAIQDFRDGDNLLSPGGGAEDSDYAAADLPYGAKDRAFESVTELQQVLGIDNALYVKLVPHVTINTGLARPEATFADGPVLQALGLGGPQVAAILAGREPLDPTAPVAPLAASGTGTYSISSRATRPDGTRAVVHATVRLGATSGLGQLYTPLAWRVGDPD